MTYWDASALVPLLLKEVGSDSYRSRARETQIVTWWGSAVECTSAIERRVREGETGPIIAVAYRNLEELVSGWREIHASESLRRTAIRLLKTTPLRSADALHLAAALIATNFDPPQARFFTQDTRLKAAAVNEGFLVD